METKKFTPNEEAISKRAEIKPFGRAATYDIVQPEVVQFVLSSADEPLVGGTFQTSEVAPAVSSYVPPTFQKSTLISTQSTEVTVRVSNIPKNLPIKSVYDFFMNNCGKCFLRCNLAYDKESGESRGIAYVTLANREKATEFAHKAMTLVIDNLKLGVEILERR